MNYENIKVNSYEYKKLSGINKLKVVRFKLDELFNDSGKNLSTVIYNGEKKQINKNKMGYFKNLVEREKKLEKSLKYTNLNTKKEETFNFLKAYVEKNFNSDRFNNLSYEEKIDVINEKKNYFHKSIRENGNDKHVLEVIDYLEDLRMKLDIDRISGKVEKEIKNEEKEKKNLKTIIFGLPIISKIKNTFNKNYSLVSEKIKRKKTKIAAAICAGIIAFTGLSGLNNSNNNRNNDLNTKVSITSVDKNNDIDNTINEIVETAKPEVIKDTLKEDAIVNNTIKEESINFDDTVTILDNSSIYTNSYDASYNYNPCNALYDSSYERNVEGLSYELDGKIYTVYQNEDNAYEKVNLLVQNGATLKAVLVTRTDLVNETTHEGYYNADSVRVRVR